MAALSVLALTLFGCQKENDQNPEIKNKCLVEINTFRPSGGYVEKSRVINKFRTQIQLMNKSGLKVDPVLLNMPADTARWLLETTLNSYYANVYDSTLTDFDKDTIFFEVNNVGFSSDGIPILNGNGLTEIYTSLVELIDQINTDETTFYLGTLQIESFDESNTTLSFSMTTALGDSWSQNAHLPIVLKPWENPVPFTSGESYYPVSDYPYPYSNTNPNPNWAGAKIAAKLNAHMEYLNTGVVGYILERVLPDINISFTSQSSQPYIWGGYNNGTNPLNNSQLNTYLNNYRTFLSNAWTPYGYDNTYVMRAEIYHFDMPYYAQSQGWPPSSYYWLCPWNNNYYSDWHYLVFPLVKFIPIPPPGGGGNGS